MKKISKKVKTEDNNPCNLNLRSTATIDCLPDECLILIFKKLSLRNMIGIERVCKKWRKLSLKSWSKVKSLDIDDFKFVEHLNLTHLREILWRCGSYVNKIYFDETVEKVKPGHIFTLINRYCKQLLSLVFMFSFGHEEVNLKRIAPNIVKHLKKFEICFRSNADRHINDDSLAHFLKLAENLECMHLYQCLRVTPRALLNLSNKCKELDLYSCDLNNDDLTQIFQKLLHLEDLDASWTKIRPSSLFAISEHLVLLSIRDTDDFFKDNSYKNLYLPKLELLDLKWHLSVTDEIASSFYKCFPSLTRLCLVECTNMRFDASCCLGKCKNLKVLDISKTKISDDGLSYLVKHLHDLKWLCCSDCDNLTESGYITAVSSLSKLDIFRIGSTSKFTERFFKEALKSVMLRTEDKILAIDADNNEDSNYEEEMKRLKLKKEKCLCSESLPESEAPKYVSVHCAGYTFHVDCVGE